MSRPLNQTSKQPDPLREVNIESKLRFASMNADWPMRFKLKLSNFEDTRYINLELVSKRNT